MSADNILGVDSLVEEYLIHRGFTQTFRIFQKEKSDDRTHGFHAIKIVEQIYHYIENYKISEFIDLWDFLNKRFFIHLDQENLTLLDNMKIDLIKSYLVNLINQNKKQEMTNFFETYSHEIIAHSGNSAVQLRSWYALPYMSHPEKDPEFSPYFSKKWADMLRVTLHNFLSTILFNTPEPKLLFLEKWFRSDAQEETRRHLQEARNMMHENVHKENVYEDRLYTLQGTIRELVTHIHEQNTKAITDRVEGESEGSNFHDDSMGTTGSRERPNMSVLEDFSISDVEKIAAMGNSVCELAASCMQHSHLSSTHHHDSKTTSRSLNCKTQSKLNHVIEMELLTKIQDWLHLMETDSKDSEA
mmetsp:Transcript_29539/g.49902  ORF Transcript_29539/g.49902 Transcript_29539/m.49902 type:complete len:358 (-) Transcript_29539:181-1254(-)